MTFAEFLHMGGYAFYVWSSYALAAVVLIANVVIPLMNARKTHSDLAGKLRREDRL